MKLILATISCFIFFHFSFSQINKDGLIVSNGEIPEILKKDIIPFHTYLIDERVKKLSILADVDNEFADNQLISSGLVHFGSEEVNFINSEFNKLVSKIYPGEKYDVLIFRSHLAGTFNIDKSIFITTKLLANLTDISQLNFFLLREIEAMKQSDNGRGETKHFIYEGFTDILQYKMYRSEDFEMKLDLLAFQKMEINGISRSQIFEGLMNFRNSEMPFGNIMVSEESLNSSKFIVPKELFVVDVAASNLKREKLSSILDFEKKMNNRVAQFGELVEVFEKEAASNDIKELVLTMQIELLWLQLINCEFSTLLYNIEVLEKTENIQLSKLKALAWLGVVDQEFGGTKKRKYAPFYGDNHMSTGFLTLLNLQNGYSRTILALNVITQLIEENLSDKNMQLIRNQLISILNSSKSFDVSVFKTGELPAENKSNTEQLKVKNTDFYLYALDHLVEENELMKQEQKSQLAKKEINYQKESIYVKSMSKIGVKDEKSRKIQQKIDGRDVSTYSIESYKEFEQYALMMIQANENSKYSSTFIPFNYEYYSDKSDNLTFHNFSGYYRPTFKQIYFIGLSGIGLAYVIPHLFLGSQSSWNTSVTIDHSTGEVVQISQEYFKDYMTKTNVQGRIHATKTIKK